MALPRKRMSRQWLCRPSRQARHWPQARLGLTATRVPTATAETSAPTRVTVPAISWPSTIGWRSRIVPVPPWL